MVGSTGNRHTCLSSGTTCWLEDPSLCYWIFALIGLCAAMPILHLVVSPRGRKAHFLSWKPLVQLGVVSYGVYLWHNPIFFLIPSGQAGWLNFPVQIARLAVTAVFVIASYRYIEKPMLRIKERFSGEALTDTDSPVLVSGRVAQS